MLHLPTQNPTSTHADLLLRLASALLETTQTGTKVTSENGPEELPRSVPLISPHSSSTHTGDPAIGLAAESVSRAALRFKYPASTTCVGFQPSARPCSRADSGLLLGDFQRASVLGAGSELGALQCFFPTDYSSPAELDKAPLCRRVPV